MANDSHDEGPEARAALPARRRFMQQASVAALAAAGTTEAEAARRGAAAKGNRAATGPGQSAHLFLNPAEARFVVAAVARLIPSDDTGPGALDADVPAYIDRQLAGAWGAGERLYRSGPWQSGTPQQGYQLPFTPAELFRAALRGVEADVRALYGRAFDALPPREQDRYLTALQQGERDLGGVPSAVFFESLWGMTLEGFFADPAYGGNRDMVAWRMIGFPGAYANYYHLIDAHGAPVQLPPVSLAQDGQGHIRLHPVAPAGHPRREPPAPHTGGHP